MKAVFVSLLMSFFITGYAESLETSNKNPEKLLSEVRQDLSALQAEFIQYEQSPDNRQLDVNTGLVWMQSPSYFRWEYQEPYEQLIVADGEQVWVYDEDLEQVTVKQQDNSINPIYVIINEELSKKHYELSFEGHSEQIDWLRLTPLNDSDEVKYVLLGVKDKLVQQIKVYNQFEQIMVFEFRQIRKNPTLADHLFTFEVPEGVDVIRALGDE